ncbi:hypothetical protein P5673_026718 [Acropora cervicornis]|uniref:Uncharacterized protein n=1 Tax=Acropora cervicornis TaxID=6130 RepID=A0AAD9Q0G4_ACRCE|nr:hypothetical protein P5673_026718 [Acropora cervicornis]
MKTKVELPPPGAFQSVDKYCTKRWKHVQHLANQFWVSLEEGVPFQSSETSEMYNCLIKGDEELPRDCWQLARMAMAYKNTKMVMYAQPKSQLQIAT